MRDETAVTRRILTSPEGQKIIDMVSPVYSDGPIAVSLFQAIGAQLDKVENIVREMKLQCNPTTATWALDYWEAEYGIAQDRSLNIRQRQQRLLAVLQYRAPMNPTRVASILSNALGGVDVRIEENTGKHRFRVWVTALPSTEQTRIVERETDKVKPAQLVFDVKYTQYITSSLFYGGVLFLTKKFEIRQVV